MTPWRTAPCVLSSGCAPPVLAAPYRLSSAYIESSNHRYAPTPAAFWPMPPPPLSSLVDALGVGATLLPAYGKPQAAVEFQGSCTVGLLLSVTPNNRLCLVFSDPAVPPALGSSPPTERQRAYRMSLLTKPK